MTGKIKKTTDPHRIHRVAPDVRRGTQEDREAAARTVFMQEALLEARKAEQSGEVPVGAVVVANGQIIGRGHNCSIVASDPTGHAEIIALREAARAANNYRLTDAQLFVTLEPCLMCAGASVHARIKQLVFGARDPRTGSVRSRHQILDDPRWNHRVEVVEGLLADECGRLVQEFFQKRRRQSKGEDP
jgi:tRNA(adenine34) deaminase